MCTEKFSKAQLWEASQSKYILKAYFLKWKEICSKYYNYKDLCGKDNYSILCALGKLKSQCKVDFSSLR